MVIVTPDPEVEIVAVTLPVQLEYPEELHTAFWNDCPKESCCPLLVPSMFEVEAGTETVLLDPGMVTPLHVNAGRVVVAVPALSVTVPEKLPELSKGLLTTICTGMLAWTCA